jgi:peptide/nickel transport system substrate-binding protein
MILAERYEFNSDLTGATIQLKPGLEFHNGAPVTASDYVFGLELLNDPESFGVTGSFQLKKFSDSITDFKIVDDLTIDFTFDKPRPNMTDFFAQLMVTHRDSYADVIGGKGIVGTGPFTWDEYSPGEKVSFKKNENYHYSDVLGGPHMDGVEVNFFADMDAMGLAFEAGELDMFYGDPSVAARFRDDGLTRLTPKRGVVYVGMNVTSDQLGDPRVRRALFYAVDRTRAVTELGEGFGEVTAQSWPKGSPAWREALEAPLYYPEDAKKLLAEAGFKQTRPIVIDHRSTQSYIDHATLLKENFEAIGVEVELNAMEPTAFIKRLRAREFPDLWITAHAFANLSPVTNFLMTFPFREGNMSFYEPEEYISIIRALETVNGTSDAAQAQYDLFEKLWIENPWLIPMRPTQSIIVKSKKLQGFDKVSIAPQEPPYAELWLDS